MSLNIVSLSRKTVIFLFRLKENRMKNLAIVNKLTNEKN